MSKITDLLERLKDNEKWIDAQDDAINIIEELASDLETANKRLKTLNDAWHAHEAQIARLEYLLNKEQDEK